MQYSYGPNVQWHLRITMQSVFVYWLQHLKGVVVWGNRVSAVLCIKNYLSFSVKQSCCIAIGQKIDCIWQTDLVISRDTIKWIKE
jgi:hypothetical protein